MVSKLIGYNSFVSYVFTPYFLCHFPLQSLRIFLSVSFICLGEILSKGKILIVEDDLEICRLVQMYLEADDYQVSTINDGAEALQAIQDIDPDLILLDLMLPGLSGADICVKAKQFFKGMIMVLTASEEEMSEVSLLRFGADDYMTKPVRGHVLLARIEALLRRKEGRVLRALKPEYVSHNTPSNTFHIDEINKTVNCQGHNLQLTAAQFEIFQILMENKGKIVSREQCCQLFRGVEYGFNDRSIDMRISGLRKKLAHAQCAGTMIRTIRNKGYMLVDS
ncbi:Transcriptional regulatory protein YycF (plasmid) [Vibrio sp. THAF190c]|nr:Transcriptional regulatory protein YycF [Vibrio sp. THAF190c]